AAVPARDDASDAARGTARRSGCGTPARAPRLRARRREARRMNADATRPPPRDRTATSLCVAALVAAGAAWVAAPARTDLSQPYEPDLVETAREMRVRGDWVPPRLNGLPYLEKPPLYYWTVLALSALWGALTVFAARLPSLVAAAATAFALHR